jgi:hypothetical protein
MTNCDLRLGRVNVTSNQLTCNASTMPSNFALPLLITGTGENPIAISSSDLTVFFRDLNSTFPIQLSRSSANLVFEGVNQLVQVACADESNVSVAAIGQSSIAVKGSNNAGAGIGTPENPRCVGTPGYGRCVGLYILNGSVSVEAHSQSAGIGTGYTYADGDCTSTSAVENLMIMNGTITATGAEAGGPGIGTGMTSGSSGSATSTLANLTIMNGTITATSAGGSGAGIGTGSMEGKGGSSLTSATIAGGIVMADWDGLSPSGRGIGPGDGEQSACCTSRAT